MVPAVVRRGEFCLAILTGGSSPLLAARLADEMEQRFGPEYGAFVELLGVVRDTIKGWTSDPAARRAAIAAVLDSETELRTLLASDRSQEALDLALSVARTAISTAKPGFISPSPAGYPLAGGSEGIQGEGVGG